MIKKTKTLTDCVAADTLLSFCAILTDRKQYPIAARAQILAAAGKVGIDERIIYKYVTLPKYKAATHRRGFYDVSAVFTMVDHGDDSVSITLATPSTPEPVLPKRPTFKAKQLDMSQMHHNATEETTYIPETDPHYVKWGHHTPIEKILKSGMFFPVYVAGPSGNGKTIMVEQICAKLGRKFIRVNLSPETDEDDLIGGFRLQDGNTVFSKGPVVRAMEEGAVLLLDEIDRATNKIMCLQSVLEGKNVLLKKICETVYPAPGFTIVATANTTGRGDDGGRYTAASLMDEAFLERFPIIVKQPFPSRAIEMKIVLQSMERYDVVDADFANKLVDWAKIIRQTYDAGGIDDLISTRRLDHAVKTYSILQDRTAAIALITNRFSEETAQAFGELYAKIDAGEKLFTDEQLAEDPLDLTIENE